MLEWLFPAWDEAKCSSFCEIRPAPQALHPLVMGVVSRDFFRFLFVTCSLFVIHSVGGVLGSQQVQRNVCGSRTVYKEQPFSKRLHMKISRNWVSDVTGCEESGTGSSALGCQGSRQGARSRGCLRHSNCWGPNENK